MTPTRQGSIRLFRFAGIEVFLHWSWFLVAAYAMSVRSSVYSSPVWNVIEYLSLFGIVLMHEFGHSLACRQVGGQANQIVLWPLGGVAYVSPPQRPGATLWSIAAGPLVNAVLLPILTVVAYSYGALRWNVRLPDPLMFLQSLWTINLVLLIFNMLPIYPLDGGQILRSLLWFIMGRARSLMATAIIGFGGVAGLIALAWWIGSIWLGVLSVFIVFHCWGGFQEARALLRFARSPRREGYACPVCRIAPPAGEFWMCGKCHKPFDTFATQGACPHCGEHFGVTRCPECGDFGQISGWLVPPPLGPRS
ncbi:MAG: M50 family metallopeptidase [Verrucomicrobia bacterium]|nr:M50 family metallopeptidase [Verrucomicrobiota bacterium]